MLFSYLLCCQTSTSAVLQLESVMLMPTARILLVLICVRANLGTVEMAKHVKVRMVYSQGARTSSVCVYVRNIKKFIISLS